MTSISEPDAAEVYRPEDSRHSGRPTRRLVAAWPAITPTAFVLVRPLLATTVALLLPGKIGMRGSGSAALSAVIFVCLAGVEPQRLQRVRNWNAYRALVRQILLGFLVALMWAALFVRPATAEPIHFLAVFAGAGAEEYVFRCHLPASLATSLQWLRLPRRGLEAIATITAQILFVACHFVAGAHYSNAGAYAGRLFVAGLLFTLLVRTWGLGLAAAVHTVLNLFAYEGPGYSAIPFGLANAATAGMGLFAAWSICTGGKGPPVRCGQPT